MNERLTELTAVGSMRFRFFGQVAQLVEQRTENPRVGGSSPSLATRFPEKKNGGERRMPFPAIPLFEPVIDPSHLIATG